MHQHMTSSIAPKVLHGQCMKNQVRKKTHENDKSKEDYQNFPMNYVVLRIKAHCKSPVPSKRGQNKREISRSMRTKCTGHMLMMHLSLVHICLTYASWTDFALNKTITQGEEKMQSKQENTAQSWFAPSWPKVWN